MRVKPLLIALVLCTLCISFAFSLFNDDGLYVTFANGEIKQVTTQICKYTFLQDYTQVLCEKYDIDNGLRTYSLNYIERGGEE